MIRDGAWAGGQTDVTGWQRERLRLGWDYSCWGRWRTGVKAAGRFCGAADGDRHLEDWSTVTDVRSTPASLPSGRCMHPQNIHRPRLCCCAVVPTCMLLHTQPRSSLGDLPDLPTNFLRGAGGCSWGPLFVHSRRRNWRSDGKLLEGRRHPSLCWLLWPWPPCRWPWPLPVLPVRAPQLCIVEGPISDLSRLLPRHRLTARRTQTPDEQVPRCAIPVWPRTESASRIYSTRCPLWFGANAGWIMAAVGA